MIFLGFTKLLVGTGYNHELGPLEIIEVVDLSSPTSVCKNIQSLPLKLCWSAGVYFTNILRAVFFV